MRAPTLISILMVGWAICVAMSFLHAGVARPTGFGFNVIVIWLLWQVAAFVIGVTIVIVRFLAREPPTGWFAWACLIPPVLSLGLALVIGIGLAIK